MVINQTIYRVELLGERGDVLEALIGRRWLAVVSDVPTLARLPGYPRGAWVYDVNLGELTAAEAVALVQDRARRFDLPLGQAWAEYAEHGLPVLVDGTTLDAFDITFPRRSGEPSI